MIRTASLKAGRAAPPTSHGMHMPQFAFWAGLFLLLGRRQRAAASCRSCLRVWIPTSHFFVSLCAGAAQVLPHVQIARSVMLSPADMLDG